MPFILLTFDLEEFDLPLEYGLTISAEEQMAITNQGLDRLQGVLDKHGVAVTFFTTAYYAEKNVDTMRQLAAKHEIASHMYYHLAYDDKYIAQSKFRLEELLGIKVEGFRMPRLKPFNRELLINAGYRYDSSLNPTFIPGKYNNFFAKKTPYTENSSGCIVLPASVSTFFRIPLFWLSFKNFPCWFYNCLCRLALKRQGYLNLYIHPWEFADLGHFSIPAYVKRHSGDALLNRLDKLIGNLKKRGQFVTAKDFVAANPILFQQ